MQENIFPARAPNANLSGIRLLKAIATPSALLHADAKPTPISQTAAMALAIALVAVIGWFDYLAGEIFQKSDARTQDFLRQHIG